MVDARVACVGESTVYRVLSEADLLSRWKCSAASSGEYHFRPNAPNQQWHTDVMYVGGRRGNRDVAAVIKAHNLIDIRTKPRHPESDGIVERFNGTVAMKPTTTTVATICRPRPSLVSSCATTTTFT